MVVYPPEREAEVMAVLGPWVDENWAAQHALELAEKDIQSLNDNNLFFAWFNKGTSHVLLKQYVDAATAYDQAFSTYAKWDEKERERPYRIMWYQTGPYFAYYYSARYADVQVHPDDFRLLFKKPGDRFIATRQRLEVRVVMRIGKHAYVKHIVGVAGDAALERKGFEDQVLRHMYSPTFGLIFPNPALSFVIDER